MTSTTVAATIGAIMLALGLISLTTKIVQVAVARKHYIIILDALLIIGGTGLLTAALTWGGA